MKRVEMPISALKETKDNMLIFEFEEKPILSEILKECEQKYLINSVINGLGVKEQYTISGTPYIKGNHICCRVNNFKGYNIEVTLYNGVTRKFAEIIIASKFKAGDFVKGIQTDNIFFVCNKDDVTNRHVNVDRINKVPDAFKLSTKEEFEAQLAKENLKFNYETLSTEPLDEFAHLPQKIEDLIDLKGRFLFSNGSISKESIFVNKESNYNVFPSKYAQVIQVQPKLLQLYESWKDEGIDWNNGNQRKFCVVCSKSIFEIQCLTTSNQLFCFLTKTKAERFLNQFRDLLEQYKLLMGGQ